MNVAVIGLGYVGAVTAACLAKLGHRVWGVDRDAGKADAMARGVAPVAEPGLDELLRESVSSGLLSVTDVQEAVQLADVIMVAVGTPSTRSGSLDLGAVLRVAEEIGGALPQDGRTRTVVIRSTVLPGTTEESIQPTIESATGRSIGAPFTLASNPEFLREGTGVRDFFEASRTIIGANDEHGARQLAEVYGGIPAPVYRVSIRAAEVAKYCDNAFHAAKIAFANEISSFARRFGVDGRQVMDLMVADDRLNIGPAYLRPGFAFGGSCLPKDLRALTDRARKSDLELPLLDSLLASNAAHLERCMELIEATGRKSVGMIGLSFKSATDDLRESPSVALAERLLGRGYQLAIFDPDVTPEKLRGANREFMEAHLPHLGALLKSSLQDAIAGREVLVATKPSTTFGELRGVMHADQVLIDLAGIGAPGESPPERYSGIGW